jgi:thioredoxin-like negative regulator of GroEL
MTVIRELDSPGLVNYLSAAPGGVVIDFWSNWCRRCLRLRPQLEQLAADLEGSGWSMVAVNAEAAEEAVDAFEVRSLPTIVFCVGGKEQDRLTGSLLVSTIAEQVERWTPAARNGHQLRRPGPSGWRWIRTY